MAFNLKISNVFDPHESLFKLPIFIFTMGIIYLLFLASLGSIISTSDLSYQPGYEGLNNLFVIFKVPIALIGISVPVFAILASLHKSEQTKEQIRVAVDQNNFVNYYKHLEEFEKYCEGLKITIYQVHNPRRLHSVMFSSMRDGNSDISPDLISFFDDCIYDVIEKLKHLQSDSSVDSKKNKVIKIYKNLVKLRSKIFLQDFEGSRGEGYKIKDEFIWTYGNDFIDILMNIGSVIHAYEEIASFDHKYNPPGSFSMYRKISFTNIPNYVSDEEGFLPNFTLEHKQDHPGW